MDARTIVELRAQAIRGLHRQVAMDVAPLQGRAGDDPARPLVLLHLLRPAVELVRDGVADIQTSYTVAGRFGTAGDASGTVPIRSIAFTYQGERYAGMQKGGP